MRQGRETGGAVEKHGAGSGGGTIQDLTCGKQKSMSNWKGDFTQKKG